MFWYVYGVLIIVAHVPIVIDSMRFVSPSLKLARIGHRSRYVLVVTMTIIGCTGLGQFLFVFLPVYVQDPFHSFPGLLHIAFAFWVWINVLGNYFMTVFTHPGEDRASGRNKEHVRQHNRSEQVAGNVVLGTDVRNRALDSYSTSEIVVSGSEPLLFSTSNGLPTKKDGMSWKPEHGNYCKMCKFQVAYVDHHCPYIGSCVGLNNYSYFYIGLCYTIVGIVYGIILTAPLFWKCDVKYLIAYLNIFSIGDLETEVCEMIGTQSRAFIPLVFGVWFTGMMVVVQTVLLLADVSTFTVLKNSARVPILRFMGHRIRGRKFLQRDSRLNILLLSQRAHWYHFFIPVWNLHKTANTLLSIQSV